MVVAIFRPYLSPLDEELSIKILKNIYNSWIIVIRFTTVKVKRCLYAFLCSSLFQIY